MCLAPQPNELGAQLFGTGRQLPLRHPTFNVKHYHGSIGTCCGRAAETAGYDHAVRASGARIIEVGFNEIVAGAGVRRTETWEYETAFSRDTAGVVYVYGVDSHPPLHEVVRLAHDHDLPVLVDAAGELPPRRNLSAIAATGADLVAFSGGKAIRGPQSTGILCGRRDLISSAALQMLDMDDHFQLWDPPSELIDKGKLPGIPRHGIGRGMKVSKEEIAALLTALDLFASGAYDQQLPQLRSYLELIACELSDAPIHCDIVDAGDGESPPILELAIDDTRVKHSAFEICQKLRNGSPPIHLGHGFLTQPRILSGR